MIEKDFSGCHLLVVEDVFQNFSYVEAVASKSGIKVYHAKNGIEAIRICRETPELNMILMDAMMPEMDGFTATREIKLFRPDIPVVMLTAFVNHNSISQAVAAGCNDYLSKPLGKTELIATLRKWLFVKNE
jgi:two-component system cell cycle response regulator DivK